MSRSGITIQPTKRKNTFDSHFISSISCIIIQLRYIYTFIHEITQTNKQSQMSNSNYFSDSDKSPSPRGSTSGIVTDFKAEKLVPLIKILRKVRACSSEQQCKVMKEIPNIFRSYGAISLLNGSILRTLCHERTMKNLPAALYHEIVSILPSDNQLNLRDSVYESKLIATPENQEQNVDTTLSMTLLRIPSDLQFHTFHYLDYLDLVRTQQVCRSMCIAARNPLSLYSLAINPNFGGYIPVSNECFSQPTVLTLDTHHRLKDNNRLHDQWRKMIGNMKWDQYVTELIITDVDFYPDDHPNLPRFDQLEKITISKSEDILLSEHVYILSYDTLRELTLKGIEFTEEVIDYILKFVNLEKLSLEDEFWNEFQEPDWDSGPIFIPKLKEFSFQPNPYELGPICHRILIGSHPEIVTVDSIYVNDLVYDHLGCPGLSDSFLGGIVAAIRSIKRFNVVAEDIFFLKRIVEKLQKVKVAGTKLFEQSSVSMINITDVGANLMPRIIDFFQLSQKSALKLHCWSRDLLEVDMDQMIADICDAPYGTFHEITVNMDFDLCSWRETRVSYLMTALDAIYQNCDRRAVQNIFMDFFDEAEKRMKMWLLFDQRRMKQIGLRKLNVNLKIAALTGGSRSWTEVEKEFKDRMGVKERMVLKPELVEKYQPGCLLNPRDMICVTTRDMICVTDAKKEEDTVAALRTIVETMVSGWMEQRVERWKEFESRCTANVDCLHQSYTICLSLRSDNVDSEARTGTVDGSDSSDDEESKVIVENC